MSPFDNASKFIFFNEKLVLNKLILEPKSSRSLLIKVLTIILKKKYPNLLSGEYLDISDFLLNLEP